MENVGNLWRTKCRIRLVMLGLKGYRKSSINPNRGAYLFLSDTLDGGWGWGVKETGGLFNLAKMVLLLLHGDLECKVEKLKY